MLGGGAYTFGVKSVIAQFEDLFVICNLPGVPFFRIFCFNKH